MIETYEGLNIRTGTEDRQMVKDALYTDYPYADCKGHVVLDLGAHVGAFTKRALEEGALKIIAIEPWTPNRELLEQNFGSNPLVEILSCACAAHDLELSTRADSATGGVSGFVKRRITTRTEKVQSITLDELVQVYSPTFIKLDIEGAEYGVLPCPLNGVQVICGELHTMSKADRKSALHLLAWLEDEGFYLSYLTAGPKRDKMFERLLWMHFHAYRRNGKPLKETLDDDCDLDAWPETDTSDIGEKDIVEQMPGRQPQLAHNDTKVEVKPRVTQPKKVKESKATKQKDAGGGWGVHPKFYGQGKVVKSIFNGEVWVADYDKLVDDINKSLKEKGKKNLFEEPRQFGASSGIRGGPDGGIFVRKADLPSGSPE